MKLEFSNLCLVLSLLYGQFSFAMPDDLPQSGCVRTDSVNSEIRGRNSERALIPSSFALNNAATTSEASAENALVFTKTSDRDSKVEEWMAEYGINANVMNNRGWSSMYVAALYGNADIVEWLISQGEDVNSLTKERQTPLMVASERGYSKIVELLVKNGASIDVCTDDGLTPLMGAAFYGRSGIVRYLVDNGADMSARANDGSTAAQLAASHRHWEIVDFLKGRTVEKRGIVSPFGISLPVSE